MEMMEMVTVCVGRLMGIGRKVIEGVGYVILCGLVSRVGGWLEDLNVEYGEKQREKHWEKHWEKHQEMKSEMGHISVGVRMTL